MSFMRSGFGNVMKISRSNRMCSFERKEDCSIVESECNISNINRKAMIDNTRNETKVSLLYRSTRLSLCINNIVRVTCFFIL
jgi:hypothetical protein